MHVPAPDARLLFCPHQPRCLRNASSSPSVLTTISSLLTSLPVVSSPCPCPPEAPPRACTEHLLISSPLIDWLVPAPAHVSRCRLDPPLPPPLTLSPSLSASIELGMVMGQRCARCGGLGVATDGEVDGEEAASPSLISEGQRIARWVPRYPIIAGTPKTGGDR